MPLDLIEDSIMYVFEDILERIENKKNDYQRYNGYVKSFPQILLRALFSMVLMITVMLQSSEV